MEENIMAFDINTQLFDGRYSREPAPVPEWAHIEHLENIMPLRTLWKLKRAVHRK